MATAKRYLILIFSILHLSCGGDDGETAASASSMSGDTEMTEELPALCQSSSDCGNQGNCLNKPCDMVDEPGCGEFRCYDECADPLDTSVGGSASWGCADNAACCGGLSCMNGTCTEEAGTT